MPGSVASGCAQEVGGSHFRTLSLLLIVLWDPQTKAILAAQARPRRGVAGGRSSRNHGGSHVSKLPSRTYWYFGEDRKPGLKKKKKKKGGAAGKSKVEREHQDDARPSPSQRASCRPQMCVKPDRCLPLRSTLCRLADAPSHQVRAPLHPCSVWTRSG